MHSSPQFECYLIRKSVVSMDRGRVRCTECRRTPLVGECLYVVSYGKGERLVCQLCHSGKPEGAFGDVLRQQRVHASERALHIRAAA